MTAHQLWRFPRGPACLRASASASADAENTPTVSITEELQQLSNEELVCLRSLICQYHTPTSTHSDQCTSVIVQHVRARIDHVWPLVRRFDNPQAYKQFIKRCSMSGDGRVGSTREVEVVSGLPAASSTERLEILDEEQHILSFKIVGGQHRLQNYHSVTTLHESMLEGKPATIVIESYIVDVPHGNTIDETRVFVDTIVKYNLHSLARKAEHHARRAQGDAAKHSNVQQDCWREFDLAVFCSARALLQMSSRCETTKKHGLLINSYGGSFKSSKQCHWFSFATSIPFYGVSLDGLSLGSLKAHARHLTKRN